MANCSLCAYEKILGGCNLFPPKPIPQGNCSMMTPKICHLCGRNGDCPPKKRMGDYCSDWKNFFLAEVHFQTAVWVR